MKSNRTKGKILDTSIKLFNEKKASNVSTVQISTAMKISPGNLYYYYANKEEVIRYIWKDRMLEEIDQLISQYEKIRTARELLDFFKDTVNHCFKYRFFYTEMSTLCINDNSLIGVYSEVQNRIKDATVDMYRMLTEQNKAVEVSKENMKMIVDNGIALLIGLISYCDVMSMNGFELNDSVKFVWKRMACYLRPLFTDKMNAEVDSELSARGVTI